MATKFTSTGVLYPNSTIPRTLGRYVRYRDKAIFGYGFSASGAGFYSLTNQVNSNGLLSTDTTGVGTVRGSLAAATYGSV
jgi:hypothetical protein